VKRSGPIARRRGLTSNADAQKAWEKRTRDAQVARQQERGLRTAPRRATGSGGRVVLPAEPKPVPGPPVEFPASAGAPIVKPRRTRKDRVPDPPELLRMKREVKKRSGGLCEANWPGVCPDGPHRGENVHHVVLRSQGGADDVDNGLHLCHLVHTHAHDVDRAGAEARGIIRSAPPRPSFGE
jgi:hypothetical protein